MKKLMLTLLTVVCLTSVAHAKEESKLVEFAQNDNQTMYGMVGTLIKEGQYRVLWTNGKYKKDGARHSFKDKRFWSAVENKQKWVVDCESAKTKSLMFILYDARGTNIYSEGASDVLDVVPGTFSEAIYKIACYNYGEETPPKNISQPF